MSHEEALNLILANACPRECNGERSTFHIDLHCISFEVEAKPLGNLKYEVLSCKKL